MIQLWNALGGALTAVLAAVPMPLAKALVLAFLAVLGVVGFFLPREYSFLGAPDRAFWRDLRFWALIVIVLEMIPYVFL